MPVKAYANEVENGLTRRAALYLLFLVKVFEDFGSGCYSPTSVSLHHIDMRQHEEVSPKVHTLGDLIVKIR